MKIIKQYSLRRRYLFLLTLTSDPARKVKKRDEAEMMIVFVYTESLTIFYK